MKSKQRAGDIKEQFELLCRGEAVAFGGGHLSSANECQMMKGQFKVLCRGEAVAFCPRN